MKDDNEQSANNPTADPRRDRLKLALRENLKRRKSQARGRGDVAGAPTGGADAALDKDGRKKPGEA